jgi:hypothetical protein
MLTSYQRKKVRAYAGIGGEHDGSMYSLNTPGCTWYGFKFDDGTNPRYPDKNQWQGVFLSASEVQEEYWQKAYPMFLDRITGKIYKAGELPCL